MIKWYNGHNKPTDPRAIVRWWNTDTPVGEGLITHAMALNWEGPHMLDGTGRVTYFEELELIAEEYRERVIRNHPLEDILTALNENSSHITVQDYNKPSLEEFDESLITVSTDEYQRVLAKLANAEANAEANVQILTESRDYWFDKYSQIFKRLH